MTTQIGTVSTDVTSLFGWLGTLDQYISFVPFLSMMETTVGAIVLQGFMSGVLGNTEMVYWAIVFMLTSLYVCSGYVAVKTVEAAVSFVTGFYFIYAGASTVGDQLAIYELIISGGWTFWAFFQVCAGTYFASEAWTALDNRIIEAKEGSIGLENVLNGEKTIKAVVLHVLVAFVHMTIAYCMGTTADPLVSWVDKYADKTKTEGTDKDDGDADRDGTAAREDIYYHVITAASAMFAFGITNLGSYWFYSNFLNINGDDGFQCDLSDVNASSYSQAATYAKAMTNRATCLVNIQKIFDLMDKDNDGMISRCEDAKFQYASGSSEAYALKFSSPYSRASANQICTQDFEN